ncbi:hypothetical protein LPW11_16035 [Geomonas sp. RF6]|uniref:hypothetical protein n=1 Tax=Geomonas sp. RF6 TaxID=2897342 RepID=UPI001E528117|nr:hypothetical protein [Geomonas sp. RF6]UFS69397.1 hypothetical protein LPW11_16035 [Geomonas sp. RF6]
MSAQLEPVAATVGGGIILFGLDTGIFREKENGGEKAGAGAISGLQSLAGGCDDGGHSTTGRVRAPWAVALERRHLACDGGGSRHQGRGSCRGYRLGSLCSSAGSAATVTLSSISRAAAATAATALQVG